MPKQTLFLGNAGNDGTGDTLRQAGQKINYNFDEIYSLVLLGLSGSGATLDSGWRDFVLNVLDSSEFVKYDQMVTAISTGTFGINARIDSIDGQLIVGSQWYVDLQSSLQVESGVDSSFVLNAVAGAEQRLETLIEQDSNGFTILSQSIDSVSTKLDLIDAALGVRIGANTAAISTLSSSIIDSAGILAIQASAIDSLEADLSILRNVDSDIIQTTTVNTNAINALNLTVYDDSTGLSSIANRVTLLENGITVEINSDTIASIQSAVEDNIGSRIDVNSDGIILVNQRVTTLEGEVQLIDSDFIVTVTGNAREALRTDIIASVDSGYAVLNTKLVELEAGLTLIDSDFIITATAGARDALESSILLSVDSDISILNSKVVALEGALEVSGRTDSDIISVTAAARDELRTNILYDADSGAITLLNEAVVSLEGSISTKASTGDVTTAVTNATSSLTALINSGDSNVTSVLNSSITSLQGQIDLKPDNGDITTAVSNATNSLTALINSGDANVTSVLNAAVTSLQGQIDLKPDNGDITTAVSNATTSLTSAITAGDSAVLSSVSAQITNLEASIGDDIATATSGLVTTATLNSTINGLNIPDISAKYFVNLDVNNHFAGFELNNNGVTSDFTLTASNFKFVTSTTQKSPFSISGDNVLLSNATVTGSIDVKSSATGERMEIKNNKIEIFDASNNVRVKLGFLG